MIIATTIDLGLAVMQGTAAGMLTVMVLAWLGRRRW